MLSQSFTYQLASIAENAVVPAARLFEQRFGLDVHELRVLRLIDDQPGVTFTALAQQTRFERSATSRILSSLVKAGLVERAIDHHDARQFRLRATQAGKSLRKGADPLSLEIETLILSALTDAEQKQFRKIIDKLNLWLNVEFLQQLELRYPDAARKPSKSRT
jgi:DNA-binding MarR family transcriptional regulator